MAPWEFFRSILKAFWEEENHPRQKQPGRRDGHRKTEASKLTKQNVNVGTSKWIVSIYKELRKKKKRNIFGFKIHRKALGA